MNYGQARLSGGAAGGFTIRVEVNAEPEGFQAKDDGVHTVRAGRFNGVTVGAEFVGPIDISLFAGGAEHDDRQPTQAGLSAQPLEDIKPSKARHFNIEQHQVGEGMPGAVGVAIGAGEVINRFLAIGDKAQGSIHAGFLKSVFQ